MILVGFGYWGKKLARIFKDDIKVIVEVEQKKLEEAKIVYNNILTTTSLKEALSLNSKFKKIAIVANNSANHFDTSFFLLENNYDLWIEKPVTTNLKQLNTLIEISEKNKNIVFVDYTYCYDQNIVKVKNMDLGNPVSYRSIRLSNGLIRNDVNILFDLAIHDLSVLNYLYPNLVHTNTHIYKINKDHVFLTLEFKNNFKAVIECNWDWPIKKRLVITKTNVNYFVHDSVDSNILTVYDSAHKQIEKFVSNIETLNIAREHFLKCVHNRTLPKTNLYNTKKIFSWIKNV